MIIIAALSCSIAAADPTSDPAKLAALLAKAESGAADVDYVALRKAFLASDAASSLAKNRIDLAHRRKDMWTAEQHHDDAGVLLAAEDILKVNPIDLEARQVEAQACDALHHTDCAAKKSFALGVLHAILDHNDGLSCATAFSVTTVEEQRYLLRIQGLRSTAESTEPAVGRGVCHRVETKAKDGKIATTWFRVETERAQ